MNFPIGYGHDQMPQQAASDPPAQEPITEAAEVVRPIQGRRRARAKGGKFAADDPATTTNEAWLES